LSSCKRRATDVDKDHVTRKEGGGEGGGAVTPVEFRMQKTEISGSNCSSNRGDPFGLTIWGLRYIILYLCLFLVAKVQNDVSQFIMPINPLNPELNPICYLLALLAHHFLHVSRIRVKSLTLR